MAAFTIVATSVRLKNGAQQDVARVTNVVAAETIVPGEPVTATGHLVDPSNAARVDVRGIALNYAAAGSIAVLATSGIIEFSNTVSIGKMVYAAPSGDWQYYDDIEAEDRVVQIGHGHTANSVMLRLSNTGVSIPGV